MSRKKNLFPVTLTDVEFKALDNIENFENMSSEDRETVVTGYRKLESRYGSKGLQSRSNTTSKITESSTAKP